MNKQLELIKSSIKSIPNHPKEGIIFRDITSLLEVPAAFKATIDLIVEKYKDQGLQIVGVSVDSDREKWQGTLDKHQPAGIQISELKGWESVSRVDYGVQAIPFTVLIDASGKILARNPHGPLLEDIIEKYFSKK